MTPLLSTRKRAEEFAAAVDGDVHASALRPEMAELVGVVGTLQREGRQGLQRGPRTEFTASLREQLMAEAAASLAAGNALATPVRRKGGHERPLAIAATSIILVGGTAGMAAAAQHALPGEALYPIKRGLEKAQTGLATSDVERGEGLLAQAENRLGEAQALFDRSAGLSQVPATIDEFTAQATEAMEVLLGEFARSSDPAIIAELRTFAADSFDELQELAGTAPAEHQDELAVAAELLVHIDAQAQALCWSCASELEPLEMPTPPPASGEGRDAVAAAGQENPHGDHPATNGEVRTGAPEGSAGNVGDATGQLSGAGPDAPAGSEVTGTPAGTPAGAGAADPGAADPGTADPGTAGTAGTPGTAGTGGEGGGVSDQPSPPTDGVDAGGPSGDEDLGELVEEGAGGVVDGSNGGGTGGTGGSGDEVLPGGGEVLPEGGEVPPEGGEVLPEGGEVLPGGGEVPPEGTDEVVETIVP